MRRLSQVEAAGDDVAQDEALDAELIGAVARGIPVRFGRSASESRGSRNEKTLRSSSALAAASTVYLAVDTTLGGRFIG